MSYYLKANVLIALSYLACYGLTKARSFLPRATLRVCRGLLLLSLILPWAEVPFSRLALPRPLAQVGVAASRLVPKAEPSRARSPLSPVNQGPSRAFFFCLGLLGAVLFVGRLAILGVSIVRLACVFRTGHLARRVKAVRLLYSDRLRVPFAFWVPAQAWVALPIAYLAHPTAHAIALRHELEHHRQGDTRWSYFTEALKLIFFLNPFSYAWAALLEKMSERACDAALIRQKKASPLDYAKSLLFAASRNRGLGPVAFAVPIVTSTAGKKLQRRILMLPTPTQSQSGRLLALGAVGAALVLASAAAAVGALGEKPLTLAEAQARFLPHGRHSGGVPLTVNELVLDKLNRYLGTEEGRRWVKEARARMPQYQSLIEKKLAQYGLPKELVAIPFWESGFKHDVISPVMKARGIWQFIPSTARRYGLTVTEQRDERLDAEKATDAAVRYLKDLHAVFKDWLLAIKAYNEGEGQVTRLIHKYGTKDAWALERRESREGYLSGVMAGILLLGEGGEG